MFNSYQYRCFRGLGLKAKCFYSFILLLNSVNAFAESDSLLQSLKLTLESKIDDTVKVRILSEIVDNTYDLAIWPEYNELILELANSHLPNSDPTLAFIYNKYKGYALNNKGLQIEYEGNRISALNYYQESLALHRVNGCKKGMSSCLNNIGSLLYDQEEYELALKYYNESIKIKKELGFELGLAWTYMNVGSLEEKLKRSESAFNYYTKAYKINVKLDNIYGRGAAAHNIGNVIMKISGNSELALDKYRESLRCYTAVGDSTGISWELGIIGHELFKSELKDSAIYYVNRSLRMAKNNGYQEGIAEAAGHLVEIFKSQEKYEKAFKYQSVKKAIEDSMLSNKVENAILRNEMQFVYNQEKLEVEKEQEKKDIIAIAKHEVQETIITAILLGLFAVVVFFILLFQRFKKEKAQKLKIEKQRDEIKGKNTEIIDSITYAERIQKAIMKIEEYDRKRLPEHFILFKPKDIVSGDFYWVKEIKGMLYLAVADCTGHGVPGALMSMLGISLLNDILNDNNSISPGDLLTQLRARIIIELNQSEDEQASKDGMDISLIKLDLKTAKADWAGANNPLWIVRKNDDHIEEIKPNKEPISYYSDMNQYTNNSVQLNKGDSFYLFSDGYPDQFGGIKGKKIKLKTFKDLVVMNAGEEMEMQKLLLNKFFENWKGDLDQIDDICVLGVKI